MGFKFSEEVEAGTYLVLHISNKDKSMDMGATVVKMASRDIALISLAFEGTQRLNFSNVTIDVETAAGDGMPIMWRNVKISYYQNQYVLQVFTEGMRHNRRGCFRVSVGIPARINAMGKGGGQTIIVKDVSLSGFAITDRKKELGLSTNDTVHVVFEDIGHKLDLMGRVVRIEEREDMTIYGMSLTNLCKDLSSYVSVKQRRNKGN